MEKLFGLFRNALLECVIFGGALVSNFLRATDQVL